MYIYVCVCMNVSMYLFICMYTYVLICTYLYKYSSMSLLVKTSTVPDHLCVRLASSVRGASERKSESWVWVPRETYFISQIKKLQHNTEYHIYHLIRHHILKEKGKWSDQRKQNAEIKIALCEGGSRWEI